MISKTRNVKIKDVREFCEYYFCGRYCKGYFCQTCKNGLEILEKAREINKLIQMFSKSDNNQRKMISEKFLKNKEIKEAFEQASIKDCLKKKKKQVKKGLFVDPSHYVILFSCSKLCGDYQCAACSYNLRLYSLVLMILNYYQNKNFVIEEFDCKFWKVYGYRIIQNVKL